jgi:lysophospholipase L1-like esterase
LFIWYVAATGALAVLLYVLRQTRFANAALLIFSGAVCISAVEGYYRFCYAESDGFARLAQNFAARYYHYDQYGLRGSNLPLSESAPNIVVIGDSHVFGAGLKTPEERFSARLAANFPQFHVVTLGSPGWDTADEIVQLTRYLNDTRAAIPLVILAYFFNDVEADVTAEDRARLHAPAGAAAPNRTDRVFQWLSRYSRFVELFYYRIGYPRLVHDRLAQIEMFYQDPAILSRHLQTLERLRAVVQERYRARLLIVALPYLHSDELLNRTGFYERFRRAVTERGFDYIDLQPTYARIGVEKLRVSRFDPHTNGFANQLIADAVVQHLDEHRELLHPPLPKSAAQP